MGYLWDALFRNVSQVFLTRDTVTGIVFVIATWLLLLPKKRFVPVQHDTIRGGAAEPRQSSGSA